MVNDKINNKKRASQLHLFEDMGLMRNISPTDIDLFVEYNRRLFILGEGKYMDNVMIPAQKQAFESLCDAISQLPHYLMWVLLYRHEVHDTNEPVYVKDQYVIGVYSSIDLIWRKPTDIDVIPKFETINGKVTMKDAIKQIETWCLNNCKFSV